MSTERPRRRTRWRAGGEVGALEEARRVRHDPHGLRAPRGAQAPYHEDLSGRCIAIERIGQWARELLRVGQRSKRRSVRQSRTVAEIGNDVQVGFAVLRTHVELEQGALAPLAHLREAISVVGERVAKRHHRATIGIAAQDAQAPQRLLAGPLEADEHPISAQEEVATEHLRQVLRPESLGLHERDRDKREVVVGIEDEALGHERRQHLFRQRIRKHEGPAKMRRDCKGMAA